MTSVTVEAIYQDGVLKPVEALILPDNAHVLVRIIPIPNEEAQAEYRFKQRLVELGLLKEIKIPFGVPGGDRRPVQVKGKPISQDIIEERR